MKVLDTDSIWSLTEGTTPLVAVALHDGHALRPEVASLMALTEEERLREEDPFTAKWTRVAETRIVGSRSRFEVDLNRPRELAVYLDPKDAWGLNVYRESPPQGLIDESLGEYDSFYAAMRTAFDGLAKKHPRFVVLDLHSYNHRREGAEAVPADPAKNPEVNLGTGTMLARERWSSLIDRFVADLQAFPFDGGTLDVRENVRFSGGYFAKWVHETFPEQACVLSIEIKKFFMDEWTGHLDEDQHGLIHAALESTIPGILESLAS